jgi:hypothetical protein
MAIHARFSEGAPTRGRGEAWGTGAALVLSVLIIPLAALAAGGGLLVEGLYRDGAALVPVLRGQDLLTLVALPIMAAAIVAARRGSPAGLIVWLGALGYLCYTYLGASVAYAFNTLILVYIAIFSLTVFAMAALCARARPAELERRFDERTPRRAVAIFLALMALFLGAGELAQIVGPLRTGELPAPLAQYGLASYFVYALDLGLVVPLSALGAVWLWRGQRWGALLAGVMLIKAGMMGTALLSMSWFAARAGGPGDGLLPLWLAIAAGGTGMAVWLLRHCR